MHGPVNVKLEDRHRNLSRNIGIYRKTLPHIQEDLNLLVHSVEQKSIGLKFSKSPTGSDVRYSCHHNSSRYTSPIFAFSWRFSVFHSLQSITPRIY